MIITSPSSVWLEKAIEGCRDSFAVSSPYISTYLSTLAENLRGNVNLTVLTRTTLADFAARSSDLDAVTDLARRSGGVLSLSSLHAKVYIVDQKALITSANATHSGMYRNRECGYELTDTSEIDTLSKMILSGFASTPEPQLWTVDDLQELRDPVERLRAALPPQATILPIGGEPAGRLTLNRRDYARLIRSFSGWLQLTLEGVSRINRDSFSMDDVVAASSALARERFPANKHVRAKLRQQMQRLRDLGLVAFLGRGRYQRIASHT